MPAGISRVAALFCLILLAAAPAKAAELFTVHGVAVEARAENTEAAKQQALADARRKALEAELGKLVRRADLERFQYPDDAGIDAMVTSIQVEEEQTAPTGYRAVLTFEFEPDAIRNQLRLQAIPFTELRSPPILVLPILRTAGEAALWSDPNPWLEAWERFDSATRLIPVRTPFGDVEDVLAISPEQALAGDQDALSAMADRYGVETVVVLDATLTIDQDTDSTTMDVSMMSYGPDSYPLVTRGFTGAASDELPGFLDGAVRELVGEIEDLWKSEAIESFGQEQVLSALVPLDSLDDWLDISKRIESVPLVQRLELEVLNANGALVAIHHAGDDERLRHAALSGGLVMEEQPDGYWTVTRRGNAR